MFDDRLPTHLWVQAGIAQCSVNAIPAVVERKGDAGAGTVLVKFDLLDGTAKILLQQRNLDGVMGWVPAREPAVMPLSEADAYTERASARDPDLWVVTIEDANARNPFE